MLHFNFTHATFSISNSLITPNIVKNSVMQNEMRLSEYVLVSAAAPVSRGESEVTQLTAVQTPSISEGL